MNSQSCSEHLRHSKFPCNLLLGAESSASKFLLSASSDLAESTVIDYLGCLSIILLGVNGKERARESERETQSKTSSMCRCRLPLSLFLSRSLPGTLSPPSVTRSLPHACVSLSPSLNASRIQIVI